MKRVGKQEAVPLWLLWASRALVPAAQQHLEVPLEPCSDTWLLVLQSLKIVTAGLAVVADSAWGLTTVTLTGDMN